MKRILLADTLHESFTELIRNAGIEPVHGHHLSAEQVLEIIDGYDGMAIRSRFPINQAFISKASRLRCIGRAGAGMENIDMKAATAAGITCVNAPEGNRTAVAEHALGMLLMLMNHLGRADEEVRQGIWKREENRGTELEGKTVGIIGFGNMGSAFARRLSGFGVQVLALDPYVRIDKSTFPYVDQCSLDDIKKNADIISLHLPLNEETRYMVNDEFIAQLHKRVVLINTARGRNVDTASLVRGLESGKIAGAALDVLEYESLSFEKLDTSALPDPFRYLIGSAKVVLSPHIAGWTHESNEKIARILAEKMIAVLR